MSRPIKALLKDWDVISALRACGRMILGCEGRCRCYEVDIDGCRMVKVATNLEFGPKRGAVNRGQATPSARGLWNSRITIGFGLLYLVYKM